jgi:hypothetical protein
MDGIEEKKQIIKKKTYSNKTNKNQIGHKKTNHKTPLYFGKEKREKRKEKKFIITQLLCCRAHVLLWKAVFSNRMTLANHFCF